MIKTTWTLLPVFGSYPDLILCTGWARNYRPYECSFFFILLLGKNCSKHVLETMKELMEVILLDVLAVAVYVQLSPNLLLMLRSSSLDIQLVKLIATFYQILLLSFVFDLHECSYLCVANWICMLKNILNPNCLQYIESLDAIVKRKYFYFTLVTCLNYQNNSNICY